jgi:DNA replication factor GINS
MEIDELLLTLDRNRIKLQKIEDGFYTKIRKKIEELEKEKNLADDSTYARFEDEIRTIRRIQKKIFELRTGRIISAAWAEVCGQKVSDDVENMNSEERKFFRELVETIRKFKTRMLEGIEERKAGDYVLVRIKRDLEIQGVDGKTYKLKREDAVTLPSLNANALIKSGMAEKIEVKDHEIS